MDWTKFKSELEITPKEVIGDRVKYLRNGRKLSQQGLADIFDINQSTISAIESGKKAYSERILFEIAMEFHDDLGLNSISEYFQRIFNVSFDKILEQKIREIIRTEFRDDFIEGNALNEKIQGVVLAMQSNVENSRYF